MSQLKQIVFIPHWVYETLKRKGLTVNDVVHFDKIRPHFSTNDLAGLWAINTLDQPFGLGKEYPNSGYDLRNAWWDSATGEHRVYFERDLQPALDIPRYKADMMERLFSAESRDESYEEPFIIYDLTPRFVGCVVYPGFFTGEEGTVEHQFTLLEALLKALYVNTPFHLVAASHVFFKYLGLLSKKRIMV